jgi:general stress protein YciG
MNDEEKKADTLPAPAPKKLRGFAALIANGRADEVREIARKGGKQAHVDGTAHTFTTEEAKRAGSKGGKALHAKRRAKDTR